MGSLKSTMSSVTSQFSFLRMSDPSRMKAACGLAPLSMWESLTVVHWREGRKGSSPGQGDLEEPREALGGAG